MKKLLMSLVCLFALVALVACGQTNEEQKPENPDNGGTTTPTEAKYKLGMGVVVNYGLSWGKAEISSTTAVVVTDEDGKIVACRLDVAQNKVALSSTGELSIPEEFEDGYLTKAELKEDYGMANTTDNNGDEIVLEWYKQALAFESHIKGMTAEQVKNMPTKKLESGYVISSDEDLLTAGCTIKISEFQAAVVKACNDAQGVEFKTAKEFTLGLAINSKVNNLTNATAEAQGKFRIDSEFGAAVVVEGTIVAALNDALQPTVKVTADGKVFTPAADDEDNQYDFRTKREQEEDYGMLGAGGNTGEGSKCTKEWYEQSLLFSKYVVGKTAAQVKELATQLVNKHNISTDAELLNAGCTIDITTLKAVIAKAATNAR